MATDVFISYSRKDSAVAGRICAALTRGVVRHIAFDGTVALQALIVGRARESETDGYGFGIEFLLDRGEALNKSGQAALGVGGYGLQAHGFHNLFIVTNC